MVIGFIGCGNMASAMIKGIIESNWVDAQSIVVSNRSKEKLKKMEEKYSLRIESENKNVAECADLLVLSVKPQMYVEVMNEIKDHLKKDALILTIAPGFTLSELKKYLGEVKIIRSMPNTPAMVGEGMSAYVCNENCNQKDDESIQEFLNCFGKCAKVSEAQMDAVTAVSGSSPAYVYMFIEAMADAAVKEGLARNVAYEFAAQAVLGSAKMVLDTKKHPGELKDMVCSPAGTTIEAVSVLEKRGFRGVVMEAMEACANKSGGMGK